MEKSTTETVKSEKAKPEKELCDGVSQLRDEESIGTIGDDMEDVHDVAIREILANDKVEDVLENSPVEPNDQDVREETDRSKKDVVSVVMPIVEVAVENSEVKTASSDPSMVEPSLSPAPSAAKVQEGLLLLEQKSDHRVVNNMSVSPVLRTNSGKEDLVSVVDEVAVENCEVDTPPALTPSSNPSVVDPLNPSAAKGQGLSLLEQKSVNNVSVSPVLRTNSGKEDLVSVVDEVAVENREVETSPPGLTKSSDPSVVEPSLPSGLSLLQRSYDSRVVRNLSVSPGLRTPPRDGYNWRKYGQKQVKSPKGSRSYYRCTYSECCAKKIECSNDSGKMVQIVTKGLHSHEPPRKSSFSPREIRAASAVTPVSEDDAVVATVPSDSTKENICQSPTIAERKRHCENEAVEEPEPKRRLNKENTESSVSVSKPGKKHRHVVHAADDVGISGDGYRWRKYGQKMVKGNPNPRNYYRCTSTGCPVRKHIETAVENTRAVVITYKGEHNHDTPVPKKGHDTPSSVLLSPTSMRTRLEDQVNQCSVGRESEKQSSEALDVVGG
ncbi:putative WRKY transcription factor 32 [Raphanus sativus]|uniref:Probable WRKY transcription factor 32 isoform X2 n=1 Tax=Raphanus sativus TaxID=3726 RepID=A0A9W3DNM3_RAPSA|nr:probable WRKY transcription factor 32 isoform X2 [Raphanus sativus]KAJ4899067.1 putative WRKY transcription factor 32 [Raphanus sativus]